jgi:NADPH-dependent ferric siderophore reductase
MAESRDRARASERRIRTAQVLQTWRVTPRLTRIVLGGEDLVGLPAGEYADEYVKVLFPRPGDEARPALRALTVRAWDPDAVELTIDVVDHGVEGLASPWAAMTRPGDEVLLRGPGGAYTPTDHVDWHLLIGDESALPAIATSLERMPGRMRAYAFVEVADKDEEQPLVTPAELSVVWVHRDTAPAPPGEALVEAVRNAWLPSGVGQAFLHGEAGMVKALRHHLRFERGITRERLSASGYWRRGVPDEGWRAEKRQWNHDVEADEATLGGS